MSWNVHRRPAPKAGFTLLELLIVTAILGIVTAAIGACLAAGIRVWTIARSFGAVENDAWIALELVQRDVENALPFEPIAFEGDETSIAFAGLVRDADGGGGRIGTIRYAFDRAERSLLRESQPYTVRSSPGQPVREVVLEGVESLRITYARLERNTGEAIEQTGWNSATSMPDTVAFELRMRGAHPPDRLSRTVRLPPREAP